MIQPTTRQDAQAPGAPPRRRRLPEGLLQSQRFWSVIVGATAFLVVMILGSVVILTRSDTWTAQTTLVLLPSKTVNQGNDAGYYDTLSGGQISATASEILGLGKFKAEAAKKLHLSPTQAAATSVTATADTGSLIINIAVSGPSAPIAEHMADATVNAASGEVNSLIAPYEVSVVSRAAGTASRSSSLSTSKFLVVLFIVGLAIALGAQQAYLQLRPHWGRLRTSARRAARNPVASLGRRRVGRKQGPASAEGQLANGASPPSAPYPRTRRPERLPPEGRLPQGGKLSDESAVRPAESTLRRTKSVRPPADGVRRSGPSARR